MVGLHEDPHAATHVPAQLVGSAAACERWWRFSRRGVDGGPAGVLDKGLAGAPTRVLPGLLELSPGEDLAGGVRFVSFALRGLGLGVAVLLSFGLTLAHLPCLAWCGGARGSDCPCTVIGVQKVYPSFCTPTPHCCTEELYP